MTRSASFFAHWYFHVPNLIMAVLIYTLIGRFIVSLIFRADSDRIIVRVFRAITGPVVNAVGFVTPKAVPSVLLAIFAIAWLYAARIALFFGLALAGVRPTL